MKALVVMLMLLVMAGCGVAVQAPVQAQEPVM